ncbi:MAG: putative DNA binding domain-containing protein [Acidobacteria bacterium]|nr:putative DNA binding domain-containing protein [Acidobacteriota bacterium]
MLPINIESIFDGDSSVEWERIEFKKGWNPLAVFHSICAFANDFNNLDGGYIFIGVEEKSGKPILPPHGLTQMEIDKIQNELLNFGNSKIHPPFHPLAFPMKYQDRMILVLRVPGGENRPYQTVKGLGKNSDRGYYIRVLNATVEARGQKLTELLSLAQRVPFDDRFNQNAGLDDLDFDLIRGFLKEVKSELAEYAEKLEFEQLCRQMNIVGGSTEGPLPKNVGLMFFSSNPSQFFPQTQIDVVKLPTGTEGSRIIEKTFYGPIHQQIRNALHYISTTVIEEIILKDPNKAESDKVLNYPYQAIEELLVNAVYHRGYDVREPIEVRILPDRITITSYPGPDRSISLGKLAVGSLVARRYRNRRIGEFLKELNLTEGRGTGIPIAIKAMEDNSSPPPNFETDEDNSYFIATLPINSAFTSGGASGVATPILAPEVTEFLNENAVSILEYCLTPRSRSEIQMELKLRDAKHLRERYIYPLLEAKVIVMTDPTHPRSLSQRFKTTKLGKSVLEDWRKRTNSIPRLLFDE